MPARSQASLCWAGGVLILVNVCLPKVPGAGGAAVHWLCCGSPVSSHRFPSRVPVSEVAPYVSPVPGRWQPLN